jgi:hypothetical protein
MSSHGRPARFCVRAWRNRTDRTQEVEQTYPKIAFDCMYFTRGRIGDVPQAVFGFPIAQPAGALGHRDWRLTDPRLLAAPWLRPTGGPIDNVAART